MGYLGNNNFVSSLVPSRDINRIFQCEELNFDINKEEINLNTFLSLTEKYCLKIMNENEKFFISYI